MHNNLKLEAKSSEIKDLTWLLTREDYLINECRESFISCNTESFIYYARQQTAVARGLAWPARRFTGRQTAAARRHSLRFSVTVIR